MIRDADKKGILQIAQEMTDLSKKGSRRQDLARRNAGRLLLDLVPGRHRRHLVHAHHQCAEVAILGVSRSSHKPVWDGKQFVPRLIVPLSLSYDHRVIDGAAAARFNAYLGALLADFRRIAL